MQRELTTPDEHPAGTEGSATVLVVDDNRGVLDFLLLLLSKHGLKVIGASSGTQCLEIVRSRRIDLIVLDVMMPGMDGLQVCQELKKSASSVPVILLTARDDLATRAAAMDLGVHLNSYLGPTQRHQYQQIASSDPELLARVQQLAGEDQELLAEYRKLVKSLDNLAQMVSAADKHESRAEEQRSDFEKQGLALILRIRKHQVASDTWLSEAVYRDRGVAG